MRLRFQKNRNLAWAMIDMIVVIAVIVVLAALLLPVIAAAKHRAQRISCINNIKELSFAFHDWEGDHNNQYPMSVSMTNGSAMEWTVATNVAAYFQVMSNQLGSPKVLICPVDTERFPATNFQNDFNNSHINYFVNPDASESYPQEMMLGDDNLAIDGIPVKSGLVEFPSNAQVSWTADRHKYVGNVAYADGSIAEISTAGLQSSLILATNGTPATVIRLAIP